MVPVAGEFWGKDVPKCLCGACGGAAVWVKMGRVMWGGGSCPPWRLEGARQDLGVPGVGGHGCLGGARVPLGGVKVLEGPRQDVSRGTQVGDKDLERSLGETCQGVSLGMPSQGKETARARAMGTARARSQPAWGSSGRYTVPMTP